WFGERARADGRFAVVGRLDAVVVRGAQVERLAVTEVVVVVVEGRLRRAADRPGLERRDLNRRVVRRTGGSDRAPREHVGLGRRRARRRPRLVGRFARLRGARVVRATVFVNFRDHVGVRGGLFVVQPLERLVIELRQRLVVRFGRGFHPRPARIPRRRRRAGEI